MTETSAHADESPDERAKKTEQQMTDDERFYAAGQRDGRQLRAPVRDPRIPPGMPMSAGYMPGVPRLGIPALLMSDAASASPIPATGRVTPPPRCRPRSALAASFNPALARAAGDGDRARGAQPRVQCAAGRRRSTWPATRATAATSNTISEDPLLERRARRGVGQRDPGQGVISTLKHFCLNCNETNRHWLDAIIDPAAHRESDLLAFEIAIERSQPGAVMSGLQQGQRRLRRRQQLAAQ